MACAMLCAVRWMGAALVSVAGALGVCAQGASPAVRFPGTAPGEARGEVSETEIELSNDILEMSYALRDGHLRREVLVNKLSGERIAFGGELFRLEFADGTSVTASDLVLIAPEKVLKSVGDGFAEDEVEGTSGRLLRCGFQSVDGRLEVTWIARLLHGGNAVREFLNVRAKDGPVALRRVVTLDTPLPGCRTIGSVPGSVVAVGEVLLGLEHPMAANGAGYPSVQVGAWEPDGVSSPESSLTSFDVTEAIHRDGPLRVRFQYTTGGQRLDVHWVALLRDGREVSRDTHHGHTGDIDVENEYDLDVSRYEPGVRFTLVASTNGDQGADSNGVVLLVDRTAEPRVTAALDAVPLEAGEVLSVQTLFCVTVPGQMRRSFLFDLERNRAHPYRPFLHYNTWYDLGYFNTFDEEAALDVVRAYGEELVKKRGVRFDSFLFDDGWDDHGSLWDFHAGFPNGFRAVGELARSYGAGPGVWLSPFGGYGDPRRERLAAGAAEGFETNARGFALSGPKYFERFRGVCLDMVERFGVNLFKFDGIGRNTGRVPGSRFGSDFEAAIQLIRDIRRDSPDIFINLTTGTWPSPFWLEHADSIWRGGYDHSFAGVGSSRQQWMTYRDGQTYSNIVRGGPLYPINSLMVHGVIYAPHANKLDTDPEDDLRSEIRSAFGMGTDLQELYVSPGLLSQANWDDLAAAAKWSRAHADVLVDVHWVGGDPGAGEVYGWAAWAPGRATLTLRNPSADPAAFAFDPAEVFELPEGAARHWGLQSPFPDQPVRSLLGQSGTSTSIELQPFAVLVFDALPADED